MSKLARSLNTAEKRVFRLRHWNACGSATGRHQSRSCPPWTASWYDYKMSDDETIRQRVADRSAARAHRGSTPVLAIMETDTVKPTVIEELAGGLRWPFEDGKALYPEVNIAKMHAGIPLIRRLAASVKIDKGARPAKSP